MYVVDVVDTVTIALNVYIYYILKSTRCRSSHTFYDMAARVIFVKHVIDYFRFASENNNTHSKIRCSVYGVYYEYIRFYQRSLIASSSSVNVISSVRCHD